jgi:protein disulfide-isomerase
MFAAPACGWLSNKQRNEGVVLVPHPVEGKRRSFDEIVKAHAVITVLSTLVIGFTAGFGSPLAIMSVSGRTTIEVERLDKLQKAEGENKELSDKVKLLQSSIIKITTENKLSGLLEVGFWAYRQVDLRREIGALFEIGDCPGTKCYKFTVSGLDNDPGGAPVVHFALSGEAVDNCKCSNVALPLIEGSRVGIATSDLDFNILVESDRLSNTRLGIGVRDGSQNPDQGTKIVTGGFVFDPPTDTNGFYSKWGASAQNLPYGTYADDGKRIADAKNEAVKSGKILMVEFGANWCPDCLVLQRILSHEPVLSYVRDHFRFVDVDVGRFQKNIDLAADQGVDIGGGIPAAAFLFPDGSRVATTGFGELQASRVYTSGQILGFLKDIVDHKKVRQIQ